MSRMLRIVLLASFALTSSAAALFWSGDLSPKRDASFVKEAEAVIGRPLTPLSYAGVARRTVRRCAVGVYNC